MPDRIGNVLNELDADIVALQELQDGIYGNETVSEYLARRLGMQAYRGPTLTRESDRYGNLLLSRTPAFRCQAVDLSVFSREPRGAIEADFNFEGRHVRCFVTHLGLAASERREQLRILTPRLIRDDADVRVLAGDINEWRRSSVTRRTLDALFGKRRQRATFPSRAPIFALDRIYATPASALTDVRVVDSRPARMASDHLPVLGLLHL